jgi:hypothetical protein
LKPPASQHQPPSQPLKPSTMANVAKRVVEQQRPIPPPIARKPATPDLFSGVRISPSNLPRPPSQSMADMVAIAKKAQASAVTPRPPPKPAAALKPPPRPVAAPTPPPKPAAPKPPSSPRPRSPPPLRPTTPKSPPRPAVTAAVSAFKKKRP